MNTRSFVNVPQVPVPQVSFFFHLFSLFFRLDNLYYSGVPIPHSPLLCCLAHPLRVFPLVMFFSYKISFWFLMSPFYLLRLSSFPFVSSVFVIAHCSNIVMTALKLLWEFPGGPVVRTPCFHCRGHRFDPWSGNLRSCMPCGAAKK